MRQPSDRRPDANISIRSNGNTSCNTSALNTTDLQGSFHGSCANDSINTGGGAMDLSTSVASTAPSSCGSVSAGLSGFGELTAQDSVDKDARRER